MSKLISIADFIDVALYTLKKIDINDSVNFKSFKKDRQVEIRKLDSDLFEIKEDGFEKRLFKNLDTKELKRALKYLRKKEFPKSNSLWYKIIRNK
ncbi:hypothetical protein [Clostridium sp. B9]|uniref:hypothetical protein n=1 Tax=Clostridium sp. B9 TaxID=3423224 RepID=UPI003D2EC60C